MHLNTQLEKGFCVNDQQNKVNFSLPLRKRLAKQNVLQQLSFETTASWVLNKILEDLKHEILISTTEPST